MALTRIRAFRRTSAVIADYVSLTKPRIVVVLMLTAYGAMTVASGGVPSPWLSIVTLLGLGLAAGGAHAVNMWYDRDIDPLMARTRNRPIPAGRIQPRVSLAMGLVMARAERLMFIRERPRGAWRPYLISVSNRFSRLHLDERTDHNGDH